MAVKKAKRTKGTKSVVVVDQPTTRKILTLGKRGKLDPKKIRKAIIAGRDERLARERQSGGAAPAGK